MNPKLGFLSIALLNLLAAIGSAVEPYDLAFSTYIGGSAGEGIRDLEVDTHGNVYLRQSSMGQVRHHRESTERQYALQDRARSFG